MSACLMEGAGMGADKGTVWLSLTVAFGIDFGSGGSVMRVVSFLGVIGFWVTGTAASSGFTAGGGTGVAGLGGTVAGAGGIRAPRGFGAEGIAEGGCGMVDPGDRGGGTGMLDGGGGRVPPAPGGLGGSGNWNCPEGVGKGEILPVSGGGTGALGAGGALWRVVGAGLGLGRLICIVVREVSSVALPSGRLMRIVSREMAGAVLDLGRLICIVVREVSSAALPSG